VPCLVWLFVGRSVGLPLVSILVHWYHSVPVKRDSRLVPLIFLLVVIYFASKLVGDCAKCNPVGTVVMIALYQCFAGVVLGFHSVVGVLLYSGQICLLCSGLVVLVVCTCLVLVRILVVGLLFVRVFLTSGKLIDIPVKPLSCSSPLGGLLCGLGCDYGMVLPYQGLKCKIK
jgi:hypothetical protein